MQLPRIDINGWYGKYCDGSNPGCHLATAFRLTGQDWRLSCLACLVDGHLFRVLIDSVPKYLQATSHSRLHAGPQQRHSNQNEIAVSIVKTRSIRPASPLPRKPICSRSGYPSGVVPMSKMSPVTFQNRRLVRYLYLRSPTDLELVFRCRTHSRPLCVPLAETPAQRMLGCIPCDWLIGMLEERTVLSESFTPWTCQSI